MELLQLQYFTEIVKNATMLKAAEALHVSQSTLSVSIKKLEAELGFTLFYKQGRRLGLTEEGLMFYRGTLQILENLTKLVSECRTMSAEANSTIRVAVEAVDFSIEAITRYTSLFPETKIEHIRADREEAMRLMHSGGADLCITPTENKDPAMKSILLLRERMDLMVSKKQPIAVQSTVKVSDMMGQRFIVIKQGYSHREETEKMLTAAGISLTKTYEVNDEETIALATQYNLGVALVPISVSQMHKDNIQNTLPGVVFLPIEDTLIERAIYLTMPEGGVPLKCRPFVKFLVLYGAWISNHRRMPTLEESRMMAEQIEAVHGEYNMR